MNPLAISQPACWQAADRLQRRRSAWLCRGSDFKSIKSIVDIELVEEEPVSA